MDLISDIKVQREIIRRRRVIPVVVVVLAALAATIAVYAKEGSGKKRKRKRDSASFQTAADLADDGIDTPTSNQSGASGRENPSTSLSRRPKRKKGSMVGSMDAICKVIRELSAGLREPLKIVNSALENDVANVYNALKAIPDLTQGTMLDAYEHFLLEPARARGFLRMNEEERVTYITRKFGGL